jgi:ferredoxin-NADP reductase
MAATETDVVQNEEVLLLEVTEVRSLTPVIKQFRLAAADRAAPLPGYSAGAHISVETLLDSGPQWRRYSLVSLSARAEALAHPDEYVLAVRRDDRGRGGSKYLHERVKVGDRLRALPPRNDFPLSPNSTAAMLVAGGIGITPLATMAADLRARGCPVRLYFAGRNRESLAYLEPLQALLGERLRVHVDEDMGGPPDLTAVLMGAPADADVYVCGPQPMLDAVLRATRALAWDSGRVHFEMFSPPTGPLPNRSFEVVLARSGKALRVHAEQTLLQVLNDAGCDVLYDCERGECGVCRVPVLEGCIEHRDYVLTEHEKADGRVMHACVSRCMGERLVVDL